MLSETGEVEGMWMPTIKTHAFVIYASQEQAEATLKATMDLEWPLGNHSRSEHAPRLAPQHALKAPQTAPAHNAMHLLCLAQPHLCAAWVQCVASWVLMHGSLSIPHALLRA